MEWIAHRGGAAHAPENTMGAFRLAWAEEHIDGIEIDIHYSADDQLVVFHDSTTARCGDRDLCIAESNFDQLSTIDIGSHFDASYASERIPPLRDVLLENPSNKRMLIEIKSDIHTADLLHRLFTELFPKAGAPSSQYLEFITFRHDVAIAVKKLLPAYRVHLLGGNNDEQEFIDDGHLEELIKVCQENQLDGLDLNHNCVGAQAIKMIRSAKLAAHCWTVNDVDSYKRTQKLDLDSFTSDHYAFPTMHFH